MQKLILEMQEVLANAVARGDSLACDDAKVALEQLKRLSLLIQDIECKLNRITIACKD